MEFIIAKLHNFTSVIKKNKFELLLLVLILGLAASFRFYKISEYMTFLGDEGRDGLVVKRILVEGDFPLLGPPTSVGNMYLGPLYYYMMSVPMAIFWLDPVAAAAMNALIGVFAVGLIYYLSREWFGRWAGVTAAFLYAVSPVAITYSKSSWNPNPAPLFALLIFLSLFKIHKNGDGRWFILTGVSLAFILQMHYLALLLVPIVLLLWVYEVILHIRGKLKRRYLLIGSILGAFSFLILMSPLIIFDLKYGYVNFRAFKNIIIGGNSSVGLDLFSAPANLINIFSNNLIGRYLAG